MQIADGLPQQTQAVELASAIMLLKKNFGLGTNDFGALTVQIVWIVALLVMLPITTFCWEDLKDRKFVLRICVISLTYILFLITFVCRMISTYSGRQVGTGSDAVITESEAQQIHLLCINQTHQMSSSASKTIEAFSIGGSLWVSCLVVVALIGQCLFGAEINPQDHSENNSQNEPENNPEDASRHPTVERVKNAFKALMDKNRILMINLAAILLWSVPLFWILMELRNRQDQFATDLGQSSGSETWNFGQILAVVVFVPVLTELLNQYLQRHD